MYSFLMLFVLQMRDVFFSSLQSLNHTFVSCTQDYEYANDVWKLVRRSLFVCLIWFLLPTSQNINRDD